MTRRRRIKRITGFFFLWVASGVDRLMGYVLKCILTGVAHGVLAKGNQINVCAVGRSRRRYVRRKNTGEEDGRGKMLNEKTIKLFWPSSDGYR